MTDIDLTDLRYDPDDSDIDYDTPALMPEGEAEALERASWHLKRASMLTDELEQLRVVYKKEIEKLQIRLAHRTRIIQSQIEWHEAPVEQLHGAILRDNAKRKTIELPYGTSKMKVPKTPQVDITDKAKVLAWAEKNRPEILSHDVNVTGVRSVAKIVDPDKVTPDKPGKAVDPDTGEVIPGTQVTLGAPSWSSKYGD